MPFWPLDPGSRILNPYFWELSDNFLGKKFYNSLKIGPDFFLAHIKNKIIFNLWNLWLQKRYDNKFFSPLSFCFLLFLDPGWVKIGIRVKIGIGDKHPGSATLQNFKQCLKQSIQAPILQIPQPLSQKIFERFLLSFLSLTCKLRIKRPKKGINANTEPRQR